MFCQNCGTQNADNTVHCSNCGSPLTAPAPIQPPVVQQTSSGKGLGIASMVIGIVSLALFCTGWFAIICAIVSCALGGVGIYKAKKVGVKNGMAVAGLTCSIIALGMLIVLIIAGVSAASSLANTMLLLA